jgi:putative ABC transport system substrate-binding protein
VSLDAETAAHLGCNAAHARFRHVKSGGDLIVTLAARLRLPALYPLAFYAKAGGLISYGFDPVSQFQQGAGYVDRILRGAKPADLPVQYPTKLQLVVNLKTAKTLGLAIPESFLLRADEVIE